VVVKVPLAVALVLAARLAVATMAAAQVADDEPLPNPIPARVEIGGGGGLMVAYPEVGVLASVPIGPRAAFEVAVSWLPRVIYDVEHALAQAQFRLPFRPHLRSRRSLLIGVTRVSARKRHPFDGGFWGDEATVVFPHGGVSLQWPIGRHADFRFDAQGLFTFDGEMPLVARAATAFVWHPGGGR
jgi:hypothetical protein